MRKSRRAKHLSLCHRPGHDITIVVPHHTPSQSIYQFISTHEKRIFTQYQSLSSSLLYSHPDLLDHSREHFLAYKQSALNFCTRKVKQWNTKLGGNYQKITVKSLKTKRGSCSSKGNLNFNYKLIFLPEPMADYIIVHELCHLREMNHGPKFWKLVEEVYGPERRKWRKIK